MGPPAPLADLDASTLGPTLVEAAGAAGIGVTVTFVDGDRPHNVYVNQAAADLLGWSVSELLERDPMRTIAPPDQARADARWERRRGGERGLHRYSLTVLRKDGGSTDIDLTTSPIVLQGRPAVFAFLVDAAPRVEAERHRVRTEARFRELIEIAPECIGIVRDGRYVYANTAYVRALGYESFDELAHVPLAELVDESVVALQREREAAVVEHGAPPPAHVYSVKRKDGTRLLWEINSVYFEYAGKPSVLTMARDVTQRKQLELQLVQSDRLAALGTMAAGVAHEINNPLAYLMLNLEWVARKLPGVRDDPASLSGLMVLLDEARQGAERVSAIVRELRSFARADTETRRKLDLAEVVQSAIRIAGHEIKHRARIATTFEACRPVLANEPRLEQVIVNLLLNAAQSMPEDRAAENEIRITAREDASGHAVLEVSDNGSGIPADVLPRIFDPFFTTKPVGVGMGLGLSICHGIVTSLGGSIGVHSEPGEGTTFRVVLPTATAELGESAPPSSEAPASQELVRARVLVVDDEPTLAATLHELLSPEHDVTSATSAEEALRRLDEATYDVVLCDLMMPGTSGIELYERIKTRAPGLERRIVFMTGGAFTTRAADFLASVPNRRIEKPFSLGLVERLVREMARQARRPAKDA